MKKFNIRVNGKAYEVEVEEVGSSSSAPSQRPVSKPAPPKQTAPKAQPRKPAAPAPKAVPSGAETINAPMPGTVVDIKVSEGDTVSEGDVLLLLEAMKMENEIMAPRAGKVTAINTSKGASVSAGEVLISIE